MYIDRKSPRIDLRLLACSFGLAVMTSQALVVEASVPDPEPTACALEASLSAPGGDQCLGITPDELLELSDLIDEAVVYAEADDAANGVTGAYAGAATYSRVMLEHARDTVDARIDWLESPALAPAGVTTYAEAGGIGSGLMTVINDLVLAGHWGGISAIYHHSSDAQSACELAAQAVELANELRTRAQRCYVDAYMH